MPERTDQPPEQPSPGGTVINLDEWGGVWGCDTITKFEADTATARAEGATVHEWDTTARDGQPLRVVRVTHPVWGTDICVTEAPRAVTA
ncbi:hypothetical protein [Streptomyces sp. NPDC020607]|uniref:hypothetical protein n=1 Tax=Streptomyces sp. NPDC020607 TaxID=3365082 RepID=UPI00379FB9EF